MNDRIDVAGYVVDNDIILLASSISTGYSVIAALPAERLSLGDTDDRALGDAVLRAAARCRGIIDEPPTMADAVAREMGFRSSRDQFKKARSVGIARRHGEPELKIMPTRREKGAFLYTGVNFSAPLHDPEAIGKALREAVRLSV